MLSEVPEGWTATPFEQLATLQSGFAFKSANFVDDDSVGLPIIRIRDLEKQSPVKFYDGDVPDEYIVEKGDVLIGMDGEFNCVEWRANSGALNQRVLRVYETEKTARKFLLYRLIPILKDLEGKISGTTVKHLSVKHLKALSIPTPPLNEQHRIAEILSSVDASIQATQAVIEQAERVKRGLMEELLTGGLGSEAIERGEVPDGWQRTKQGSVATFFNGRAYKLKEWEKEGTPVIRLQNLTGSGKEYYYSTLELPPHQYCDFGDLLFMWSASFGAYIWQGGKAIYHYHIWKVEQDAAQMMRLFHYYLLQYYTDIWKQDAHGMAMLHLTKKGMEQLEITIPPLSQQEKIVQILSDADDFIAQQRANAEQQMKVKQGLMNELLTGKVRTV